jgi:hypothetical protein
MVPHAFRLSKTEALIGESATRLGGVGGASHEASVRGGFNEPVLFLYQCPVRINYR